MTMQPPSGAFSRVGPPAPLPFDEYIADVKQSLTNLRDASRQIDGLAGNPDGIRSVLKAVAGDYKLASEAAQDFSTNPTTGRAPQFLGGKIKATEFLAVGSITNAARVAKFDLNAPSETATAVPVAMTRKAPSKTA